MQLKGNNLVVSLLGSLKVKFFDLEGEWQVVEIQLPNFVISNYLYVGKQQYVLASGPLVLEDQDNALRAVVFFQGLIKQHNLCGIEEFIANTN